MEDRIVWIDIETTGLNPELCNILEVAIIITNYELQELAMLNLIINYPKNELKNIDKWCLKTHTENGLLNEVQKSTLNLKEAEQLILQFIKFHTQKRTSPLGGSSVHFDRMFLQKHMPKVIDHLHYSIIDASTLVKLMRHWYLNIKLPNNNQNHRALGDIKHSINITKFYKQFIKK